MTAGKPVIERPHVAALAQAAATSGYAPSVSNTQPWRWRVLPDRLDLLADRRRQLGVTDPQARLLTLSCGAALHHARTGLAAAGWTTETHRLPDPADPDLLASLVVTGRREVDAATMRLVQAIRVRHTDRRPVSDEPLPLQSLAQIEAAVRGLARLQTLTGDQVLRLASIAGHAAEVQADDPNIRTEMEYWTTRASPADVGLPPEVIPAEPPQTTVPGRAFAGPGTLPVGPGHDRAAVYAVLHGDEDEPGDWLCAGEALSAAWLTATDLGVSMVPLSGVIEVDSTREALRQMLAGLGRPYLALRLGLADPEHAGPPHTPRMPAEQLIDTSQVRGVEES